MSGMNSTMMILNAKRSASPPASAMGAISSVAATRPNRRLLSCSIAIGKCVARMAPAVCWVDAKKEPSLHQL